MANDDARHAALMQIIQNGYSSSAIEDTYFNLMDYETFTGLPRNDASGSEPAYLSASDLSTQYLETLVTPAIPGIAIASLLFIVCFLVVFLRVCTKCCAMCCPGSCWDEKCFRPKEYTSRQLKITKWAMLVFCIIGGIGCVLVFSQGTEVSKGVTDFGDELVNTTKSLEVIINDWYAALVQASQEGSEDLADLQSSSVDISSSVVDLNDQIKGVAEKIELSFMVVAAIVFIVAIIATGLVCLGWSTMLMLFFFTLSLVMIVCWIVFGALGTIGTLIDDIALGFDAFAMDANIQNAFPTGSSLCPSRYNSASSVNEDLRSTYYDIINEIQPKAADPTICPTCSQVSQIYNKVSVDDYCNWYKSQNDKSDLYYADPVCRNHYLDVQKYGGWAYIPKTVDTGKIDPTAGGGQYTKCDFTTAQIAGGATCGQNQVASDAYDEFVALFNNLGYVLAVEDSVGQLITCDFVQSETAEITSTLHTVVDALKVLWSGFLMLGMSYFVMWVILLVAISRIANPQLNVDSGEYDPQWAEKLSMPRR